MEMKLTLRSDRTNMDITGKAEDLTRHFGLFWKRETGADVPEDLQKDFSFCLMDGKILKTRRDGVEIYLR